MNATSSDPSSCFVLPEEEEEALALVEKLATKLADRAEDYDESGEFPWDNIELLRSVGLNGTFLPAEHGGTQLSFSCYLRMVEVVSRACPSTAITWATVFHACVPLLGHGTPEQLARYLPIIAEGGMAALAISESSGGSDVLAMTSRLRRRDEGAFSLTGTKVFITNGDVADFLIVFALAEGEGGPRNALTAVLVDRDTPGLVVAKREKKLGHRASSTVELAFDECIVPAGNVLGGVGAGFPILLETLNRTRPSIAAQALGIAQAAFDEIVRYTNERRQFGRRILDFQGVQFIVADLATQLELARNLLRHVGTTIDRGGEDDDILASMLKVVATDLAMEMSTQAVQLQGGYGYMAGSKVERLFRDAKVTQIWEGANELHRGRIGRSFLEQRDEGRTARA